MSQTADSQQRPVSTWRKVFAGILDFIMVMFIAGYTIAYFTGNTTENGFELKGAPALALFGIIILYFVIFTRYLGGTVWQRLLGARR
jgi:putative Mn2+ efflux pump MntP